MSWTDRIARLMPEPSSQKDLRSFGLIVGGGFALIALWPVVWHGLPVRMWALIIAVPLLLSALTFPRILRYPFRVWMLIGHCLGWLNQRILMTLMFYAVVTPAAIVMRVSGRDPLQRRFDPAATTYRVLKAPRPASHLQHPF